MSLVIAPLTTTALNSVEGRHSGLASGVNNAVSRTASLLAIAVMGILVFTSFSSSLDSRLSKLDLPPKAHAAMERQKSDLGAARPPEGLGAARSRAVERAVDESFVAGFRDAMLAAAALALASAVVALVMVGGKSPERTPSPAGRLRSREGVP
jgi:hypothetical protein